MSRGKKIILAVVVLLVVLVIGALAAVSILVDPNAYKGRLEAAATEALGRKTSLEGDLSLSVFPRLAIETGAIRVANPESFGGGEFASLKQAELSLELLPLLSGQIRINKISCADLAIVLVKNADGRTNWDFSQGKLEAAAAEGAKPASPAESSGQSAASGALDLEISSVVLSAAQVTYRDLGTGQTYQLKQFNLTADNLGPGEDFQLETSGLLVAVKEQLSAGFQALLKGRVDPAARAGQLSEVSLDLNAEGPGVPGGKGTLAFRGSLDAAPGLALLKLSIDSLVAEGLNLKLSLTGNAEIPADYTRTSLSALDLNLEGPGGAKANFQGDLSPLARQGQGNLSLSASLKKVLAALGSPLQTQNPAALEQVELYSPIQLSPETGLSLTQIEASLDGSKLTGSLSFNPAGQGKNQTLHAVLNLDKIKLDDYLPVSGTPAGNAPANAAAPAATEPGAAPDAAKASSPLASTDGKIDFSVGQLTYAKYALSDLKGSLTLDSGKIALSPCSFTVFQGKVTLTGKTDLGQTVPPVALDLEVKGLALGEALTAVSGEAKVTGNTDLKLNLSGAGDSWPALSKTLAGGGALSVTNGLINQVKLIPDDIAQLGLAGVAPLKPLDGRLDSLTATFQGDKGRFSNHDLRVLASIANISGAGWFDLGQNSLGYAMQVSTAGLNIPLIISGGLTSPKISVDAAKLLQDNAGQILQNVQDLGKDPSGALENLQNLIPGKSGNESAPAGSDKSLKEQGKDAIKGLLGF